MTYAMPSLQMMIKLSYGWRPFGPLFILVGVGRLELPASWSRTKRATICATPRKSVFIIKTSSPFVKPKNCALTGGNHPRSFQ